MPRRRRLPNDINRRSTIQKMVGAPGGPTWPNIRDLREWDRKNTPNRPFMERLYAAFVFVRDLELAISIAERTTGIREAGREAKAVAALKEIANA